MNWEGNQGLHTFDSKGGFGAMSPNLFSEGHDGPAFGWAHYCVLCSLCFLSSWHDIKKLTLTVTGPQLAWFIWKSSRLWSGLLNKSYPIYRAAQWWCRQKERGNFVLIFYRNLKREKIGFGLYSEKPQSQKQMLSVCTYKLSSIFFLYRGIVFSALIFSATSFRSSHYILRTYILFWDKDMNG